MSTKHVKQRIKLAMSGKKLVLDFWPATKPPEIDSEYFVLFQIVESRHINYGFGYAMFHKDKGWLVPDGRCIVNQWCALPSPKLLL